MRLRPLIALTFALFTLTACGVRGGLEPPSARDGGATSAETPVTPEEDRPFILDGLLL